MSHKDKQEKKVAVGMSGGVDSGLAAALLVEAGYQVAGFHIHFWSEPGREGGENKCCSTESLLAAKRTAHQLKIPFHTVDMADLFKEKVVDYFLKEYGRGRTPNPCVMCNRFVKFGELLTFVKKAGFDYLATGHYAQVTKNGGYHLWAGKDKKKDQSYFLYTLTQEKLQHILFPIGYLTKEAVREKAAKLKLPSAKKPESQEICFLSEKDYRPFLKRQLGEKIKIGEVVDTKGKTIGKHQGLPFYTIGQRHGFQLRVGQAEPGIIPPYYVIEKDYQKNRLVVGFGSETEKKEFKVENESWIQKESEGKMLVKIRHQGEISKARKDKEKIVLDEPERGISPGQAAVFYQKQKKGLEVLGGGIIV